MRGAVLYKLGLDIVKARDMRLSYGVDMSPAFRSGYHPTSRKYRAIDGWDRCRGVMDWYATKVRNNVKRVLTLRERKSRMEL